jgi:hypothetical protein
MSQRARWDRIDLNALPCVQDISSDIGKLVGNGLQRDKRGHCVDELAIVYK